VVYSMGLSTRHRAKKGHVRTQVIANYSFVWKWRAQAPAHHGTADISTIHNLELASIEEVRSMPWVIWDSGWAVSVVCGLWFVV
jgi:hypothetical protein